MRPGQQRLREGEIVLYDGQRRRVDLVNDARARLVSLESRPVRYQTNGGEEVEFMARAGRAVNVSPYSDLPRVAAEEPMAKSESPRAKGEPKGRVVATRVDQATFDRIHAAAQASGLGVGAWLNHAIALGLGDRNKDKA